MTSLRQRLTCFLALGLGALVAAAVGAIYPAARGWLTAEFDAALLTKARALTTLPETGREGINLAFTERVLPEFQRTNAPEYFQVWLGDGTVLARSPSLSEASLPLRLGPESAPAHWSLVLPDGRPGRAVGISYSFETGGSTAAGAGFAFALVLARDTLALRRSLRRLVMGLAAGGLALLTLMVWVVGRATRAGLRPIESLAREVTAVQAATLASRFQMRDAPAELKPVIEQLNQLMARLEAAFAREQRFAANAAHELLTPVSELRALAEAAIKWRHDPEATAQFASDVQETAQQMEQMIRALLDFARTNDEAAETPREPVAVSALVEKLIASVAPRLQARGLSFDRQITQGITLSTDPALCRTVLANLLDNAVEHTPAGGRVNCRLEPHGEGFLLTLSNTNPGLTVADLPHLFEPFWRKDAARVARTHAGLGLPLVRALAQRLGWEIRAELTQAGCVQIRLCG